jgi:hypothetical protein
MVLKRKLHNDYIEKYINLVELVSYMLDQVRLKLQKHQSRSQMRLHLKNACETRWCLIIDRGSNDESDSVLVVMIAVVSLIVDNHVMQDDTSTHHQPRVC